MKKIIDGVRYNTETAIKLGEYDNLGRGVDSLTDFHHWEAALYKTPKSGRFFLAGSGGAMSRFSQSVGQNSWSGGEDLIPLSEAEAFEWAQQYLDTDVVEEHFGHLIEDA